MRRSVLAVSATVCSTCTCAGGLHNEQLPLNSTSRVSASECVTLDLADLGGAAASDS